MLVTGCTGRILGSGSEGDATANGDAPTPGAWTGAPGGGPVPAAPDDDGLLGVEDGEAACQPSPPQPMTRLARLTHVQYDNSVRDLLGVQERYSAGFLQDPLHEGFDNSADDLAVVDRLGRDYRAAAERIAEAVAATPSAWGSLADCAAGELRACALGFVERFGSRAFRRPLTPDERDRYSRLFEAGAELYPGGEAVSDGVRAVVETVLQSPKFLYRVELSEAAPLADGTLPLDAYELATRLSYFLWNTTPDDALLSSAASGRLETLEQIRAAAERLLADPRAADTVQRFHGQWLQAGRFSNASADRASFPRFTDAAVAGLGRELDAFVRDIFENQRPPLDLLTASFTYVDRHLAPLYGLTGEFGDELERVELDPSERAGVLTQLGFLASHAHATATSPIHRGVFVQRQVLCNVVPAPPGNIDLTLPPFDESIRTTRDQVTVHTSKEGCSNCHATVINPAGFAFEHYDPTGAYRNEERETPIDASGELQVDGSVVRFDDAVGLMQALAASEQVRACYGTKWMQYTYARSTTTADACTARELAARMAEPDYDMAQLMLDLVRTKSFLRRAPER